MELQEILNIINGQKKLSEMSFPKNQVIFRLIDRGLKFRRYYYLIFIYYFRDSQEVNHWIGELTGFIPESPLLKRRNSRFNANDTFYYIWKGFVEDFSIEEVHSTAFSDAKGMEETNREREERKTGKKIPPLSWDSVKQNPKDAFLFMEEFHKLIADHLSKNGEVSFTYVCDVISSLFEKYPL